MILIRHTQNNNSTLSFCFGFSVFMILNIEDTGFTEKINLRVGRISLNFAITDVQWSQLDGKMKFTVHSFRH